METLLLIGKIYATGWLLLFILLMVISQVREGSVIAKILDKVVTIIARMLVYCSLIIVFYLAFIVIWVVV